MTALSRGDSFSILTPGGMLGYGYNLDHFWSGMDKYKPIACIVDSGSSDPGPFLLGTGQTLCSRASYIRDITPMLEAAHHRKVKVLISSAGGAGSDAQTATFVEIIEEIATANHWPLKVVAIFSGIDKQLVQSKLKEAKMTPCGDGPLPLTDADVDGAKVVVAQIGAEPFMEVLEDPTVDVIVSGRSYDPAPFAAFAMHHGCEPSTAWHMGKIVECGALCALPKGKTIVATMRKDSFDLTPMNPIERCTPVSVAAHTLYEKTRPDQLPGPGGILHLDDATYEQLADGRSVRIMGSKFVPSPRYQVKLEGVQHMGYRSIFIGGIRDPTLIACIDEFLATCKKVTGHVGFPEIAANPGDYHMHFHVYGKNAVMGPLEPVKTAAHEIGILGEVTAPTQEKATAIAGFLRVEILHNAYPDQVATAGNFALPLTPLDNPIGPVYRFSIYHLMDIEGDQVSLFPRKTYRVGASNGVSNGPSTHDLVPKGGKHVFQTTNTAKPRPIVPRRVAAGNIKIKDIASIIRSKNAGPFQLTYDILFDNVASYERVRKADVLNDDVIAKLYQLKSKNEIVYNAFFRPALAWKCTIVRPLEQGSIGEFDTFGTQQHAPLLDIEVPAGVERE